MRKFLIITGMSAVCLLSATGCAATHENAGAGDIDTGSADVMLMPKGFRNVASKCDGHGHRVFVTSRGEAEGQASGVAVIADSSCDGAPSGSSGISSGSEAAGSSEDR